MQLHEKRYMKRAGEAGRVLRTTTFRLFIIKIDHTQNHIYPKYELVRNYH